MNEFDWTRATPLSTEHEFRWKFGEENVRVRCARCSIERVFDLIAEWNHCIRWCNEHSALAGVPKVRVRKSEAKHG